MIKSIFRRPAKSLTFEELRIVQLITLQVALSLEFSEAIPIDKKREFAILQSEEILNDLNLEAPLFFVETSVEAAFGNICAFYRGPSSRSSSPSFQN